MTEFRAIAAGAAESLSRIVEAPLALVGMSAEVERLREEVRRVAASDGPVLVCGEAGSGKSLVAKALHEHSPRATERCAIVACETLPKTLLDVELFGCAQGSVSGASCDRRGVLEMVSGGTVILENIEAISARTRVALEQYLATGRVKGVGTVGPGIPANTRIVATSDHSPGDGGVSAHQHRTRWSRLAVTSVRVPSLRERPADIPLLSQFFASAADRSGCGVVFSAEAMSALSAYPWPGNVAQLRAVIERLVAGSGAGHIRTTDLPVGIRPRCQSERSQRERRAHIGAELFARLRTSGESFWSSVYPLFMRREITRRDLRDLLRRALEAAEGDSDELVRVLNMPVADRKRFEQFLRRFGCALPPYASPRRDRIRP